MRLCLRFSIVLISAVIVRTALADDSPSLPGTQPLTIGGDIAAQLVDGVDRFLLRETDESADRRASFWKREFSSPAAYEASIEPNRARLRHILGIRDEGK